MEEKRSFMRIPTRLHGHLRLLPGPDDMALYRESPPMGLGVCTADPRDGGMSESLYALLRSIDAKLDMLLSMQNRSEIESDFPVPINIVEISGEGMCFSSSQVLEINQYVEAVIVLYRFPLRMAGAIGRISRRDPEDGIAVYALDFTRIRERDLECIVQFVFQSQRDDLRGNKWD